MENKQENSNRMNTLMGMKESSETHLTPEGKIQVVGVSSKKDARWKGVGLPHTPTHSLITSPTDKELKQHQISK